MTKADRIKLFFAVTRPARLAYRWIQARAEGCLHPVERAVYSRTLVPIGVAYVYRELFKEMLRELEVRELTPTQIQAAHQMGVVNIEKLRQAYAVALVEPKMYTYLAEYLMLYETITREAVPRSLVGIDRKVRRHCRALVTRYLIEAFAKKDGEEITYGQIQDATQLLGIEHIMISSDYTMPVMPGFMH